MKEIVTGWKSTYTAVKDDNGNLITDENGKNKFVLEKDVEETTSLKGLAAKTAVVGGVIAGIALAGAAVGCAVTEACEKIPEAIRKAKERRKEKKEADITGR